MRLVPPMVCSDVEIDEGLAILDDVFSVIAKGRVRDRDLAAE